MTEEVTHDQAEIDALDEKFTKPELQAACDQFGVEYKKTASKFHLISALLDDGVNAELISGYATDEDEEDAPVEVELEEAPAPVKEEEDDPDLVLIRMIRANPTYEVRGYVFKSSHPFALVAEKDADYLIEHEGGFRMASPKEAREFYS